MRSLRLICGSRCAILSSGLRQRQSPIISQSVFAMRKSARCDPTIPVMPVMRARGFFILDSALGGGFLYRNKHLIAGLVMELNNTVYCGKQGMISAHSDVFTRIKLRSALANQDVSLK